MVAGSPVAITGAEVYAGLFQILLDFRGVLLPRRDGGSDHFERGSTGSRGGSANGRIDAGLG